METILQNLKAKIKHIAIIALIVVVGLFGFKSCRKIDKNKDKAVTSTILGPNDQEKITVNPEKHTITVTTSKGTTTTYLPDRPSSITEDKNGKITIQESKFGTEIRPYLGAGGDLEGSLRVHLGVDFFYFHKFDMGAGLAFNALNVKDTRIDLNLSYNFYSNTSIGISLDNHHVPGLFLKVRF